MNITEDKKYTCYFSYVFIAIFNNIKPFISIKVVRFLTSNYNPEVEVSIMTQPYCGICLNINILQGKTSVQLECSIHLDITQRISDYFYLQMPMV